MKAPEREGAARPIALIPALNEAERLPAVLLALAASAPALEPVVIDDGSTDDTSAAARRHGAVVLRHPFNLGYGAALQTGYRYALRRGAQMIVQLDADGQHDPGQVPLLLEPLVDGSADVVIGSRFLAESGYHMSATRSVGRRLFQGLAGLSGLRVTDPTSGFQALSRRALELYQHHFFPSDYPDVDVLLIAHRRGLRIIERPVRMRAEVRRSRLHGGLRSVYYVFKMSLSLWAGTRPDVERPKEDPIP
jgi:glycosyltransferase involved in cell wall biosynthesis